MPKLPVEIVDGVPTIRATVTYPDEARFIGIDPGQAGGLVCFLSSGKIDAVPMPDTERELWEWFHNLKCYSTTRAVIEKVHSMPDQSAQSGFTFGMGYGGLRMALIAAGIPFEEVDPRAWQKGLGIPPKRKQEPKGAWKNRLLALAQQLHPSLELWSQPKSKGKMLAVSDALLIAEFCKRKNEGKL